ncbi:MULTISPECIES: hypothetical protein [unclassified Niallia]|nr:hypothetical protein [Niallia sp. MER 6]MCM3030368.1 hypothetical protein [Niallia sp. MER 6]
MVRLFTGEQEKFLRDNTWGKSNQELAELINLLEIEYVYLVGQNGQMQKF